MAVARQLSGSVFRPRRELEDGPGESGGIDAIEGDRVETDSTQTIELRGALQKNDRSPRLWLRQPSVAGPPHLILEGFGRQQVDHHAMRTEQGIDDSAAGGCGKQAGRPGIPTIVVAADGPPPEIEVSGLEVAFVKPSAARLGNSIRMA